MGNPVVLDLVISRRGHGACDPVVLGLLGDASRHLHLLKSLRSRAHPGLQVVVLRIAPAKLQRVFAANPFVLPDFRLRSVAQHLPDLVVVDDEALVHIPCADQRGHLVPHLLHAGVVVG